MMRMTPKISVRPDAISAYTPPVRTPSTAASRTSVMTATAQRSRKLRVLLPGVLGVFGLSGGHAGRVDEDRVAVLPLFDKDSRATLRPAHRVEAHRALDRLICPSVEGVDQFLVVDAAGLGRGLLDNLADAITLSRVGTDACGGTAVVGEVLGHERRVAIGLRAGRPARRNHDSFGVRPELVRIGGALVGARGLDDRLGVVVLLDEGLDEGDRVRHLGTENDGVRVRTGHFQGERSEVRGLKWIHLVETRLAPPSPRRLLALSICGCVNGSSEVA